MSNDKKISTRVPGSVDLTDEQREAQDIERVRAAVEKVNGKSPT